MPDERPAPYLSVVIPAYNEAARIGASLDRLTAWLAATARAGAPAGPARLEGPVEIVVVDDGSADGTVAAVEKAAAGLARSAGAPAAGVATLRLLKNGVNHGKGYSIKHGVLLAAGRFVLLSDADFSTPIDELPRLLGPVAAGECDMAIGSRGMAASNIEVRQPFWREGMGRTFNKIVRGVTGLPFTDTQCGFKVMRREPVLPLFRAARIERFAYDVEILYLARKAGLSVREIPVRWKNAPGSKVRAVRDSFSMLCDVTRVVVRDRRGRYGRLGAE
jgi:glycosyltransferase involved in cell wall biosynthesis